MATIKIIPRVTCKTTEYESYMEFKYINITMKIYDSEL